MKICFFSNAQSIHTKRWVQYFSEKGHEVHLLSFTKGSINGAVMHYIGPEPPLDRRILFSFGTQHLKKIFQIKKILGEIKPDIVHGHYIVNHAFYAALSGFHPSIISAWGSDIASFPEKFKMHWFLVKYVLKSADIVHVQDPLSKKKVKDLGVKEDKIKVISWGVDIIKFSPSKKLREWKNNLQRMPGPVVIIVRNIEKRFTDALANTIDIVAKNIYDVNFVIVKSSELKNKMRSNKNVQFINWVPYPEMPFYLANSDLFIDPYYPERHDEIGHTYGMALLEAMSSGVPTLVAERPTISMLKDADAWYFGRTFKGDNVEEFTKKITELLKDKNEQKRIIKQNRAIIEKKFNWQENMKKIEKIYESLT